MAELNLSLWGNQFPEHEKKNENEPKKNVYKKTLEEVEKETDVV